MHSIVEPDANTALVYDLTTVEAVNEELGITGNTADDAVTASEITSYSILLGEVCDRVFAKQTVVETFFGCTYAKALALSRYPVVEIISIESNHTQLTTNDYRLNHENGLLWRKPNSSWGWGWGFNGEIVVTYTGGYELPEGAPASLSRAVIELIEDGRVSGERDVSIRDIQHGDRRVSYFNANVSGSNAALPASVADLIKPFKRVVT